MPESRPPRRSLALAPALAAAALAAAALAACADTAPVAPRGAPPALRRSVADAGPGRYIVALGDDHQAAAAALAAAGGHVVDSIPAIGAVVVEGVATPAALAAEGIRYAEPDGRFTADPAETALVSDALPPPPDAAPPGGTATADAPWFASGVQWDMTSMRADRVWTTTAGGAGVNTCIVDSGIDDQHQEIAGKVVAAASFVPNNGVDAGGGFSLATLDSAGHGTHVASTVTGNGRVIASVAPNARLMVAKVFAANNSGQWSWILNGFAWCAQNGAHVINASIQGTLFVPPGAAPQDFFPYQAFVDVVRVARERGVVVVIAAGNFNLRLPNPNQVILPGQTPGALVVGATGPVTRAVGRADPLGFTNLPIAAPPAWDPADPAQVWQGPDARAFYSNFGTAVDVFAPGGRGGIPISFPRRIALVPPGNARSFQGGVHDNVWAACSRSSQYAGSPNVGGVPGAFGPCTGLSDRYASLAGTSMATPHVVGLAAVLYGEIGGAPTPEARARVERCIRETADAVGPSDVYGRGRVNAEQAVAALRRGGC